MKVKIKKKGKVKEFKLINKWEDVTLEKWIKLVDYHKLSKSEEALETIKALSNIPKKLIKELELNDIAIIMRKISVLFTLFLMCESLVNLELLDSNVLLPL